MSAIEKASAEAVEAARQGETYAVMLAALQAAQHQQPACTHQHPPTPVTSNASGVKWLAIGMGGSALLLSVAVSAVAVAISAVAVTACLLILRSLLREVGKGR